MMKSTVIASMNPRGENSMRLIQPASASPLDVATQVAVPEVLRDLRRHDARHLLLQRQELERRVVHGEPVALGRDALAGEQTANDADCLVLAGALRLRDGSGDARRGYARLATANWTVLAVCVLALVTVRLRAGAPTLRASDEIFIDGISPDGTVVNVATVYGYPAASLAGIVAGASQGEGLGNKFLAHIRESAAICQVTRVFRDEDVTHVDGEVNPANDISTIQTEMILADLQTVEKAIPRLEKEARGRKELKANLDATIAAKEALEAGTPIIATSIDRELVRELSLLTAKPYLYVFNCDSDELADEDLKQQMREIVAPAEAIFLDAKFEADLAEMDDDEMAHEMLAEMGIDESGLDQLARVGFDTLGLQTYLTAGPKETRAWTIRKGATAPEAAGVIHTDFQKGFIKAEIVSFDDLLAAGSMLKARELGKVRMEGKDYVMADGDVVEFRFNV